jgi:peroxiredoxin
VNNISKTIFIDEKGDIVHVRFGSLSGREDIDAAFNAAQINETGRSGAVSNVNITSLTHDSAVISWTDSVPGTATVAVTDGRQQKIINDQTVSSSHMITVDKLGAGTTYTITITVKDSSGKEYFARGYSLRTLADTIPPDIKDAKTSKIESDSITVTWDTDEPANGQVEFGETAALGGKTTPDSILTTSHSVSVTGLKPSTTYYLRITAKDAHGNESMLDLATITTKQALTGGIAVGMRAPDFILKGIDGKTVQLSTLKGHPVMLQFFHTECRACVTEMPMIKKVYNEWRDRGLLLYTITRESHIANLQTFANIHQLTFPMLMDPDEQVTDQYQIPFTPYFIFIDREGIVREINEGRFNSESVLIEALNNCSERTGMSSAPVSIR